MNMICNIINKNRNYFYNVTLQIQSFLNPTTIKQDGTDSFLYRLLNVEKNFMIEEIKKITYLQNNTYSYTIPYSSLKNPPNFIGKKSVIVMNCFNGYILMKYYDTAGFVGTPYFQRNLRTIGIDSYCKIYFYLDSKKTYFSIEYSLVYKNLNNTNDTYNLFFYAPQSDKLQLFINENPISYISTGGIVPASPITCNNNNNCGKFSFQPYQMSINITYIIIRIRLIHLSNDAFIYAYYTKNSDPTIYKLDYTNSRSCFDMETVDPFILNII